MHVEMKPDDAWLWLWPDDAWLWLEVVRCEFFRVLFISPRSFNVPCFITSDFYLITFDFISRLHAIFALHVNARNIFASLMCND